MLVRRVARLRARPPRHAQREPGVVERAQPRQQPVALGHQRGRRALQHAGVGLEQPAHELEQRRLAAAARADDRDRLPRRRAQRDVRQRTYVAVRLRHPVEGRLPPRGSERDEAPSREPRSVCASLPPRALPHRFEGSAPGSWGAISASRPASPPVCASWGASYRPCRGPELPVCGRARRACGPCAPTTSRRCSRCSAEPDVARWFGSWDAARVQRDLLGPQDDETVLAIEVEGEVAGMLLVGEETMPDYRHASLDIALAGAHQGRGIGPRGDAARDRAHDRGARPPSLHDRPVRRQRARDPRLHSGRLPARRA